MHGLRGATLSANRLPLFGLLAANTVSLIGSRFTIVAIPWFVLQTTGSAAKTGLTGFVEAVAIVLAAFFGGTIVDRLGFKRASVLSDLASALTVALIPALYHTVGLHFGTLLVLVALSAFCNMPGATARQSLIPDLAGLAVMPLERANATYQAITRFSQMLGPVLAGLLIAALGTSNVIWIDAASFVLSALLIGSAVAGRAAAPAAAAAGSRYLDELRDGLRFIRGNQVVLTLVGAMVLISLIDVPFFGVVLPVYADRVFASAVDLGVMMSALGAGSFAGVVLYGAFGPRLPRHATFVVGLLILSPPIWLMAPRPSLLICAAALTVCGFLSAPLNPLTLTVLHERVPADMRGRVFGMAMALGWVTAPLGLLLSGYLLDWIGLIPTLVAMAALYLIITLALAFSPAMRQLSAPAAEPEPERVVVNVGAEV